MGETIDVSLDQQLSYWKLGLYVEVVVVKISCSRVSEINSLLLLLLWSFNSDPQTPPGLLGIMGDDMDISNG